ncbi:MAG: S-layer homology domain-containing protein [Eubacteriales bacterium]
MKNKKIVSLICALAMIFSMFSAMTVSAADKKGINLASTISTDNKTITLDATAVGTEELLNSFLISVNLPEGVTNDNVTATTTADTKLSVNVAGSVLNVAFLDTAGDGIAFKDGKLATITINLTNALTDDFVFTLTSEASIEDANGEVTVAKGMDATSTTVVPSGKPTPKPTSPARPTMAPVPTVNPDVTVAPTDVPVSGKGIGLTSSISSDNKTITIEATASGAEELLNSFLISVNLPEGVTNDNVTATTTADTKLSVNVAGSVLNVAFLDTAGDGIAFKDGKLATITIKLPTALTEAYAFTLTSEASIEDSKGEITVAKGMTAASTVVTPSTEPVPTVNPVKTVALKSVVSTGYGDAIKAAKDAGKDVYLTVDVKKGDQDAVYGEDYEAVYNGKTLTEAEYKNLISGYTDADMADVINGLTYNIYNSSVNNVSTTVNAIDAEGNAEQIVDPKDNTLTPAKPTAKPSEPSISVKASSTTVEFDKKFTVTATVKNAKDGAKVAFTTNDDEKYAVIFGTPTEINSKGETKATYVANDKPGTVTITATYTDTEGNEKSASVKVTVKKASTTTGGNNGTTSGGGPGIIAPGNTGAVTTPNTNTNYKPDFQDLDSVEWARTAINGLAMRGMINGRDQYTFDPNANITRAEYCQILMGAINALNAKGESTFADVPSTAWYYNAVSVASQLGIVSGYGDGNFGPNDLITRQDMALMTYKTAKIMNKSLEPVNAEITFEDSHEISDYAFEAVMTLQKAGIINGMTDTTFEPHSNATRAQSAKVIFDTFVDAQ